MVNDKNFKLEKNNITNDINKIIFCVLGIYICYLSYGIFQENIYKYRSSSDKENSKFVWTLFLLCIQCFFNALVAFLAMFVFKPKHSSIPFRPFALSAFTYLAAMGCSNEALKHVNYPTQALGKSCKMIPVMIMGVFIRKRKYSLQEYACVLLISLGIMVFQYGKEKNTAPSSIQENSLYGLLLLFASLFFDGITGPFQEQLQSQFDPSVHQQMLYTNLWAFLFTLFSSLMTGQFFQGLGFCLANPSILYSILLFSLSSALGQNFIFYTIQQFSALTCTTITTTRKFFTILFSVVLFNNTLSSISWMGVCLVFTGLVWELQTKYHKHSNKKENKAF